MFSHQTGVVSCVTGNFDVGVTTAWSSQRHVTVHTIPPPINSLGDLLPLGDFPPDITVDNKITAEQQQNYHRVTNVSAVLTTMPRKNGRCTVERWTVKQICLSVCNFKSRHFIKKKKRERKTCWRYCIFLYCCMCIYL